MFAEDWEALWATTEKRNKAREKTDSWKAQAEKAEMRVKQLGEMPEWREYKQLLSSAQPDP